MKFSKKAATIALAMTMLASATTAFAAPGTNPTPPVVTPSADEIKANGNTTISIMEADKLPTNISFEVPLYFTMAATSGTDQAIVPTGYQIKNNSAEFDIGITRVNIARDAAATWSTVAKAATVTGPKNIYLTLNGIDVPAMSTATNHDLNLRANNTSFMTDDSTYVPIVKGGAGAMNLPIAGLIENVATRTATGAAAQFKVKYTVTALDANHKALLGGAYTGDNRVEAGLGVFATP